MKTICKIQETGKLEEYMRDRLEKGEIFTIIKKDGRWTDVYSDYGSGLGSESFRVDHLGNDRNGKVWFMVPVNGGGWKQTLVRLA